MKQLEKSLCDYIAEKILPCYETFDKAHGSDHVKTVLENSMELAESLDVDINMVYAIAAYHDVGLRFGRENHEQTSGAVFMEDAAMERWFTPEQRQIMREAIEDHRASKQSEPRSIYGRIISEADRDIDPERIVRRCMEYGRANEPELDDREQIQRTIEHIGDKYGENGYLHLWLPSRKNQQGLNTLRKWLQTGEIREICEKYLR